MSAADDFEHIGGGGLPQQRLVAFAHQQRNFFVQTVSGWLATVSDLRRLAALRRGRLMTSLFHGFAARRTHAASGYVVMPSKRSR